MAKRAKRTPKDKLPSKPPNPPSKRSPINGAVLIGFTPDGKLFVDLRAEKNPKELLPGLQFSVEIFHALQILSRTNPTIPYCGHVQETHLLLAQLAMRVAKSSTEFEDAKAVKAERSEKRRGTSTWDAAGELAAALLGKAK